MLEKIRKFIEEHPESRRKIGWILVLVGLLALFTPFTPGSWLALFGLELLGWRFLLWEKTRNFWKK